MTEKTDYQKRKEGARDISGDVFVQKVLSGDFIASIDCSKAITYTNTTKAETRSKVWELLLADYRAIEIAQLPNMPTATAIYNWRKNEKLADEVAQYDSVHADKLRARLLQYCDTANITTELVSVNANGDERVSSHTAAVQAAKIVGENIKWLLERQDPARFAALEHRPCRFEYNSMIHPHMQIQSIIEQSSRAEISLAQAKMIIDMICKYVEAAEIPKIIEMVKQHEQLLNNGARNEQLDRFKLITDDKPKTTI